jgi:hypothetical protein
LMMEGAMEVVVASCCRAGGKGEGTVQTALTRREVAAKNAPKSKRLGGVCVFRGAGSGDLHSAVFGRSATAQTRL